MTDTLTAAPTDTAGRLAAVTDEIVSVLARTDTAGIDAVTAALLGAGRVFVTGDGRSGFMARAFAMRLMHLGLRVHVVGETTTPAVASGDTVVAVSGSGTTAVTVRVAEQAVQVGARVLAVTTAPTSPLGAVADAVLVVPAATRFRRAGEAPTIQPLSSLFDQTTHVLLDVVCLGLADAREVDHAAAAARHARTE
ncbi:6-phospho-3-hexuloisomerase [Cellulomonas xiejunii]|uniref:6-phospho-3-hexuloisomerase n=1 Tax=Cellulomonas xiejunii TaxID=2968083 RepID=A0ABY5KRF9_9CELL|nr:6-phospho-3-hexuloisomerase [Cellulomonas xiejunii]MCC2321451.1 6-phospho-3-hexuloisomerase [Cellulomonas xiejunii]MCC2323397.1 6-phospho-3-hexuloisomerase [Cellulomonas xiejunii]UUI72026.1 6-phospho-3-hexuloisomerase [Cellulomonas xiejunii]